MNFKDKVMFYLGERSQKPGIVRLAHSIGAEPAAVKKEMDKLEKNGTIKRLEAEAKKKGQNVEDYKWGTVRTILKRHFNK